MRRQNLGRAPLRRGQVQRSAHHHGPGNARAFLKTRRAISILSSYSFTFNEISDSLSRYADLPGMF